MNKEEMICQISKETNLSKMKTEEVLDALKKTIIDFCEKGEKITFRKFGTFFIKERKARKFINPQTKRYYMSSPKRVLMFKESSSTR